MGDAPLWEMIVLCGILIGMLVSLIVGGDKLDHWTFRGMPPQEEPPFTVYGLTKQQIRRLRAFYINRTGDTRLENL